MNNPKNSKEKWLDIGIQFFGNEGLKGINVEKMARTLSCSKGSFYWHFKDRQSFLIEMFEKWSNTVQGNLSKKPQKKPCKKLKKLLQHFIEMHKSYTHFLFHLKTLAQTEVYAQYILSEVESKIVSQLQQIVLALNPAQEDLEWQAKQLYIFMLGWVNQSEIGAAEALDFSIKKIFRIAC